MFSVQKFQYFVIERWYAKFNSGDPVFCQNGNNLIIQRNGLGGNPEILDDGPIFIEIGEEAAKCLGLDIENISPIETDFKRALTLRKGLPDPGSQIFFPNVSYDILIAVYTTVLAAEVGKEDGDDHAEGLAIGDGQ